MTIDTLINLVAQYDISGLNKIRKAYSIAESLHYGQKRQSGEDYIIHPLNVAYTLAELHADTDTICAGLLHDTIEDTNYTKEEIIKEFNTDVANMVDGVTKISNANFVSKEEEFNAYIRKIILSLVNDVRILIIKLADVLHNMRTLQYKSPYKQLEKAKETIRIYAPLAKYFGAYRIKDELEDIALSYLEPDKYKMFVEHREYLKSINSDYLEEMKYSISDELTKKNIINKIKIRMQNIYGLYTKCDEKTRYSDIHDLYALRIIVKMLDECYITLGVVHSLYRHVSGSLKDHISDQKPNMYQSIHTTLFGPNDMLVHARIRTEKMHKVASYGLTTYWGSSDDRIRMQNELKRYQFAKSLREIDKMFADNGEFILQFQKEVLNEKIDVYTPKGQIIELPKGATVIDFAYKIHTSLGNSLIGAFVNDAQVDVSYVLQDGDIVNLVINKNAAAPNKDWLDYVSTAKAKRKISKALGGNNH